MVIAVPLLTAVFGRDQLSTRSQFILSGYLAYGITIEGPAYFLISYVLPAVAVIAFWSAKHAMPRKMLIGAKIVDAKTGEYPSLKQHVIRYLGYFLSTFLFCLGFIRAAFDSRKQG